MVYSVPFQCFHLISFNYRALIFGLYFFGVVSYPLPQEERGGGEQAEFLLMFINFSYYIL